MTSDLTDLAGNPLDRPYEFDFRMADGEWKPVAALGSGFNPQVALDDEGNGVVAWYDNGPTCGRRQPTIPRGSEHRCRSR